MLLELKRNKDIKETCVTVEYRERDKQVNSLVDYVSHLNKMDKLVMANAENSLYQVNLQDILYMESVDRRTFGYTAEKTYELNCKLYEIEELYQSLGFIRISKSCIVNLHKIHALKPDYGGKILATMENKEKLYISRQYAPVLKEKLGIGGKKNERISKKST